MIDIIRGGGRPAKGAYKTADGKRVVSITTITGRYDAKDALIGWAWKEGKAGRDFKETRDDAATVGTAVHDAIEAFYTVGSIIDPTFEHLRTEEMKAQAVLAYGAFLKWDAMTKPTITHAEIPLVSESLKVGGCIDAIGLRDGRRIMHDWKTSNGIYAGHIVQVCGGYGLLWNEAFPNDPIELYEVNRFGKDGSLYSHTWEANEVGPAQDQFKQWLGAYRLDAAVNKMLKHTKEGDES